MTDQSIFSRLDENFSAFLKTNHHRKNNYSLHDLLKSDHYHKRYFAYFVGNEEYRACVRNRHGVENDWLHIKLVNDNELQPFTGYKFSFPPNGYNGCKVDIGEDDLKMLKDTLQSGDMADHFSLGSMHAVYSDQDDLMELRIYNKNGKNILITFTKGYPEFDDTPYRNKL